MLRRALTVTAALLMLAACAAETAKATASAAEAPAASATPGAAPTTTTDGITSTADTLAANRARLLNAYYATARAKDPTIASACAVAKSLTPSAVAVFETLTARLQGSTRASDGRSMLSHITAIHRLAGGDGATATDHGSCGGDDANRMIMTMDAMLHATLIAANQDDKTSAGQTVIKDIPSSGYRRNTHDFAGAHAPFDISDETNDGAPRGQVQFFSAPTSAKAKSPLGRTGVEDVIDPYALEMDQDYDCPHNSNPLCSYVSYQALCFPGDATEGLKLFTNKYGDDAPGFLPAGCD